MTSTNRALASGIATVLGLWTIVAPFVWSVPQTFKWGNVVAGVVIAVLAAFSTYKAYSDEVEHAAVPAIVVLGGLYLIVAPFGLGVAATQPLASNVVAGVLVALLGGYSLYIAGEFGSVETGESAA